jgi:hypothetical protein
MKTSIALALACLQYTEAANTTTYETLIQWDTLSTASSRTGLYIIDKSHPIPLTKAVRYCSLDRLFRTQFGMLCCVNHMFFTSHSTPSGRLISNPRTSSGMILRISM